MASYITETRDLTTAQYTSILSEAVRKIGAKQRVFSLLCDADKYAVAAKRIEQRNGARNVPT